MIVDGSNVGFNYVQGSTLPANPDDATIYWLPQVQEVYVGSNLLANVSSGSDDYTDLTNKPSINNVTLSGNKTTADLGIVIPTKTSDLTNDSGFITSADVPTKVSDLTNDSGFITNTVNNLTNYYTTTQTYTKTEVNTLIAAIPEWGVEVVHTLPTTDISTTTIYLLEKQTPGQGDSYDEYINTTGTTAGWELIGSTSIDLSNYYTKSETDTLLAAKADTSAIPTKTSDLTNDSNFVVDANYVHTDNNFTNAEKTKLASDTSVAYTQTAQYGATIGSITIDNTATVLKDCTRVISLADYNQLTPAQQSDGTVYYIYDDDSVIDGTAVGFNPTSTDLSSTSVEAAIKEVNAKVDAPSTPVTLTQTVSSTDYTCKYVQVGKLVTVSGTMLGTGTSSSVYWFANLPDPAVTTVPILVYHSDGSGVVAQLFSSSGILADSNLQSAGTFGFSYIAQ